MMNNGGKSTVGAGACVMVASLGLKAAFYCENLTRGCIMITDAADLLGFPWKMDGDCLYRINDKGTVQVVKP